MKLDIDLQSWSELMTAIGTRRTPYDELSEVDQVTDRLTLEKIEALLEQVSPQARDELLAIIHKKLSDDALGSSEGIPRP